MPKFKGKKPKLRLSEEQKQEIKKVFEEGMEKTELQMTDILDEILEVMRKRKLDYSKAYSVLTLIMEKEIKPNLSFWERRKINQSLKLMKIDEIDEEQMKEEKERLKEVETNAKERIKKFEEQNEQSNKQLDK